MDKLKDMGMLLSLFLLRFTECGRLISYVKMGMKKI